jgi:hypothetical protein
MGGGASVLAAQNNAAIDAVFTLAGAETNPSAIAAAAWVSVPALHIAGANDCITPPVDHQIPFYNATGSDCKAYLSITGASHCQFANSNTNCSLGELTCTPTAAISRSVQHQRLFKYLLPWLDEHQKGVLPNPSFQDLLIASQLTEITWQRQCLATTVGVNDLSNLAVLVYPNPAQGSFAVQTENLSNGQLNVFDMQGKLVHSVSVSGQIITVDCSAWTSGMYFLSLDHTFGIHRQKVMVSSFRD